MHDDFSKVYVGGNLNEDFKSCRNGGCFVVRLF